MMCWSIFCRSATGVQSSMTFVRLNVIGHCWGGTFNCPASTHWLIDCALAHLWIYFEDMKIGQQWRYRYKRFYNLEIDKTWTPIFAIDHHFAVLNGNVTQKQFPLIPAGASTIHAGQGSTFQQICLDMDTSDSQGFQKHQNLAKLYLQHAHYVAAS